MKVASATRDTAGAGSRGMHLAGEARTPPSTRRGASRLCRALLMQAIFSCKRRQAAFQTAMMLSAHRGAIRENRRGLS
jgi:hypothetical protein